MTHQIDNIRRMTRPKITLRTPTAEDGAAVWRLVSECKPLDENSMYCNLIQCEHFAETCVLAEVDGEIVGWVSGHVPPSDPDVIFVWQVAVSERARGTGLGLRMLDALVRRGACAGTNAMQTTITRDNAASWGLFRKFARQIGAPLASAPHFRKDAHFEGEHATEYMVTIRMAETQRRAA